MTEAAAPRLEFVRKIIEKYVSAQSNAFLVYGNIKDVYPVNGRRYVPLIDFFIEALIKPDRESAPRIVIVYDPSTGISFPNPLDKQLIGGEIGQERLDRLLTAARKDIVTACEFLRELTRVHIRVPLKADPNRKIRKDFAIIIRYAEAVAPPSRGEVLLDSDRLKVITLENWFSDSSFVASSDIVFLIGETLNGIN